MRDMCGMILMTWCLVVNEEPVELLERLVCELTHIR